MSARKDKQKTATEGSLNWKRESRDRTTLPGLKPGHRTRVGVVQRQQQR